MLLLSTPLSEDMTRSLSDELSIPHYSILIQRFPGGEIDLCPDLPTVKEQNVVLVHCLGESLHDQWMSLFFLAGRIKHLGATSLTVLLPYMAYTRQDKSKEGYAPFELIPHMMALSGIDCILTLDLHVSHLKTLFPMNMVEVEPHLIFAPLLCNKKPDVIVSPDKGGEHRAQKLAEELGMSWTSLIKKRDPGNETFIDGNHNINFSGTACLIVDDIVDTGGTLCSAVEYLKKQGAVQVTACVTHGLFSSTCLDRLEKSQLDHLYISDSLPRSCIPKWISIVPAAPLFGKSIKNFSGERVLIV